MKYALVKCRVHLLGQKPFVIYTDHASLRTATSSPHLSQRMTRWLSFFAEYNVTVEYKPGKQNVLADALSRRPDYELAHLAYLESPLYELFREAYADDNDLAGLVEALRAPNKAVELTARQRSRLHRYSVVEGLLYYQVDGGDEPRIVVPNDEDLRHRVFYEANDTPLSGHLGREKTYTSVARHLWWPHMYKWVRKYVQTCETCQRVKPAPSASAPLMSLPVPVDCWRSVSMDFIFELPADARGHTGILVFVCCLSKMVRLAAVRKSVTAPQSAQLFVDNVFRHHGLPEAFVSDRDPSTKLRPRFVGPFTVIGVHGHAYTLNLPSSMATHPPFYVGLFKPYRQAGSVEPVERLGRRILLEGVRRHPNKLFRGKRSRIRSRSRGTGRYAACLLGLQAPHAVVQGTNPVQVPLQDLAHRRVVLLALRAPGL
ncbi:hypothetical protein PR001_g25313 [Phytophthora rubi]|uniref:Integrase catalytic domain-containing protein n=1 Tax=Phytophthora rubi TaxID=129364 RepID=A0A6A3I5Z8_9STRA|nr:hypothetical protein PR001_g25313 [Phytophthora rubi]